MRLHIKNPPDITRQEGLKWLSLLTYAAGGKVAPAARVLDISSQTFHKWTGHPPTQWWYREVFRVAIELHVRTLRRLSSATRSALKRESYDTRVRIIERRLQELPSERYFLELSNTHFSPQYRLATKLLRRLLPPGEKVYFMESIEPAMREEGIALRTLGRAADELGVEKGRSGYQGPSWWRLPQRLSADD